MKVNGKVALSMAMAATIFLAFQPATGAIIPLGFSLSGSGSLLLSPAGFTGFIDSGDLVGGSFTLFIDDSGWPVDDPGTPGINERWEYIKNTFFTYFSSLGSEHWTAYFPISGTLLPPVIWHFYDSGDNLGGVIRYLQITVYDYDADQVMDQNELANQAVSGNIEVHIEQSAGVYLGMCGGGSMNGNLQDYDPSPNDILTTNGTLILRDYNCSVPVEVHSWGAVKSMYEE